MFQLIYLQLINILLKNESRKKSAAFDSFLAISSLQCVNVFSVFAIVNEVFELHLRKEDAVFFGLGIYFLITFINYSLLLKNKDKIALAFPVDKATSSGAFYIYFIMSISIFLFILATVVKTAAYTG